MNDLQKVEFDILCDVVRVCDHLNLKYFLVCGSALGAVKYGGFIPWDDDVDIALFRPDYEVFCKNAQLLLNQQYFLQNFKTDPAFPAIYSKVRDCNTTYIELGSRNLPINHGVFIDVFPIDGYPTNPSLARKFERGKRALELKLSCAFEFNDQMSFKAKAFLSFERMFGCKKHIQENAKKLEGLISQFSLEESELWCNYGNWQGKLEYAPREQYGSGALVDFEGLQVRIPENYEAYLSQKYGNWRCDPPKEEQVGHHHTVFLDLEHPYYEIMDTISDIYSTKNDPVI